VSKPLSLSGFITNILYKFLISPMYITCTVRLEPKVHSGTGHEGPEGE
jgi:hypothetical protein